MRRQVAMIFCKICSRLGYIKSYFTNQMKARNWFFNFYYRRMRTTPSSQRTKVILNEITIIDKVIINLTWL